jgi:hypothetical protein
MQSKQVQKMQKQNDQAKSLHAVNVDFSGVYRIELPPKQRLRALVFSMRHSSRMNKIRNMFNVTDEQLKQKAGMVCVTSVIVSD